MSTAIVTDGIRVIAATVFALRVSQVKLVEAPRPYNTYAIDYFAELYTKD